MKLSELQKKDLVDIRSGKKIGKIVDVEFDVSSGIMNSFMIERKGLFFSGEDVSVEFKQIKKLGEDVTPAHAALNVGIVKPHPSSVRVDDAFTSSIAETRRGAFPVRGKGFFHLFHEDSARMLQEHKITEKKITKDETADTPYIFCRSFY